MNASCDCLRIIVERLGGHGAYPTGRAILALSYLAVALQSFVSRRLATHSGALSIGWTRVGSAESVIPEVAEAGGTLRALNLEGHKPLREVARKIVEATARGHGCAAKVELKEGEPATINDGTVAATVRGLGREAGFELAPPMCFCGSDDLGFYGRLTPTLMVFVGLDGAPGTASSCPCTTRLLPPSEAARTVARPQVMSFVASSLGHSDNMKFIFGRRRALGDA